MKEASLTLEDLKKKIGDFPTKKDLYYWILFLVFLLIALFVYKFDDPKYLTDQLSLGATIFSIFLAVIAILITFMQSNESSRQSAQMSKEINTQTQEIIRLSTRYEEILNKQSDVNEKVTEQVIDTLSSNQNVPEDVLNKIKELVDTAKVKQDQLNYEKELIHSELSGSVYIMSQKEQKMLLNFIADNYPLYSRFTVESLRENLLITEKKDIPINALRNYIRKLSSNGFLEYEYTRDATMTVWRIK
ncbi:hypothetical protein [Paenibacillus lactis]|uniref:hypothetical protein n=1 Tax=Paenibacillus lactis TaxID=228574 RepID=UPI001BCD0C0C|nr:hypothetical protein [Paenibacillus lactis]